MRRRLGAALLAAAALAACTPSGSEETPPPFLIRLVCAIERLIERDDMRVREEGVSRCSGAARQIERNREQMREILRDAMEPEGEEAPQEPNSN
jgi:hypothetical protein